MADDRAYRVLVGFDAEKGTFFARVPELEIETSAATRAEAVTDAEHAIEQRIAASLAENEPIADPIDAIAGSATLSVQLAADLHRDLLHHARASGMSAEALATQMIARAIGAMDGGRYGRRRPQQPSAPMTSESKTEDLDLEEPPRRPRDDDRGPPDRGRDDRGARDGRGGRGRDRRREGYRPELDDKANFLEYLRGLEKGGGGGGGRGRR